MTEYARYFKEISARLMAEKENRTIGGYMSTLGDIAGHYADSISHIVDLQHIRDMTEEPGFIRSQAH